MFAGRAHAARRPWPIRNAARRDVIFFFAVEAVLAAVLVRVFSHAGGSARDWGVLALLFVLAIVFEEIVRRAARLQLRMGRDLKRDMTSVWAVGSAVALRPAEGAILLGGVLTYTWFRQQRPAGEPLHARVYSAATIVIGCLVAGVASRAARSALSGAPWMLAGLAAVVAAILIYTSVNRALITVVLIMRGVRGTVLLGSREDNLIELATLCLGGLLAVAIAFEPWLVVLVVVPMISLQRGALVRELEVAATTDGKTGLLNAVAWEQVAQRELARARRESGPMSVLIVDLDHFKWVNDGYGHLVGDKVLEGIGRALESTVREYDTVGRFGGEEFVAVLPSADADTAAAVAERIRARINTLHVGDFTRLDDLADLQLSVSVGVADTYDGDELELSDMLHAADRALYVAKGAGRNQVCIAGRGETPPVTVDA